MSVCLLPELHFVCFTGLVTARRHRSNSSNSASAYSSLEREPFPPKPALGVPLPYPVVTAINFINSSATSSVFFGDGFSEDSSGMRCVCSFPLIEPKPDSRIRPAACLFAPAT
jgi:hypothetical protein